MNLKNPILELRKFGFLMASILGILLGTLVPYFKAGNFNQSLILIGAAFGMVGLIYPLALKPVFQVWMAIGHILGWINSRIILSLIFFLIFTPIGLVRRLLGRDSLSLRAGEKSNTYRQVSSNPSDISQMESPF